MQSLWISDLDLRYKDRTVVKRGMLCDMHMYAAHELLRNQFPILEGLQSTLLSQRAFGSIQFHSSQSTNGTNYKFPLVLFIYSYTISIAVQILFVKERMHWVASSTTYESKRVRLYDSCSTGELTESLQVQVA